MNGDFTANTDAEIAVDFPTTASDGLINSLTPIPLSNVPSSTLTLPCLCASSHIFLAFSAISFPQLSIHLFNLNSNSAAFLALPSILNLSTVAFPAKK